MEETKDAIDVVRCNGFDELVAACCVFVYDCVARH